MTEKLRARAKELAEVTAGQVLNDWPAHQRLIGLIEAAILAGMREALREEPTKIMLKAAHRCQWLNPDYDAPILAPDFVWNAMAEARARGLE